MHPMPDGVGWASPMASVPHPFLLAGPTASGKSALAVALAEAVGGEIVNADPFQAWRGLGVLTAQPDESLRARVRHHLYGTLPLDQTRDAATFSAMVGGALASLQAQGIPAIVVSGSGFYLHAVTDGFDAGIPASDPALRAELEARPPADLLAELERTDPDEWVRIDRHNLRRVVRALEIHRLTGQPASVLRRTRDAAPADAPPAGIWLDWDRKTLADRIAARTDRMFGPTLAAEVHDLPPADTWCPQARATLGLSESVAWAAGTLPRDVAVAEVTARTRQLARRQLTWFRKAARLVRFPMESEEQPSATVARLFRLMATAA